MTNSEKPPKIIPPFNQFIRECEIEKLRTLYKSGRAHPLVSVALHPGGFQSPNQIAVNTAQALDFVQRSFPVWVQSLKSRLIDETDWTNSESALAEIRACGALLEAGFPVQLGQSNEGGGQAEFLIQLDGVDTVIEVWSRNLDEKEVERLSNDLQQSTKVEVIKNEQGDVTGAISFSQSCVAPFGRPDPKKAGDTILTNEHG